MCKSINRRRFLPDAVIVYTGVMSMFTICSAFVAEGKLDETLAELAATEEKFTREIGVLDRKFFQCTTQPHVIWSNTEWESEQHHNRAAQSLMKERRDDRFASILFGPDPYFEIFCKEEKELGVGDFSDNLGFIIVAHGLMNAKTTESFLKLRKNRTAEQAKNLRWLRTYHNIYAPDEFVAFLGFSDEESFNRVRQVGDFLLEEYLFTGLRHPQGMSWLAGYNQFICTPLVLNEKQNPQVATAR